MGSRNTNTVFKIFATDNKKKQFFTTIVKKQFIPCFYIITKVIFTKSLGNSKRDSFVNSFSFRLRSIKILYISFAKSLHFLNLYVDIGGIYAGGQDANNYNNKTPIKAKNTGNITIGDDAVIGSALYVGGIIGKTLTTTSPTSLENSGNIHIKTNASVVGKTYVGGIYGQFSGGNIKNLTNSGDITIDYTTDNKLCVAGIATYSVAGKSVTDVVNKGNITLTGTFNKSVNAGGIFAEMASANTSGTGLFTRVVNGELGTDGKPLDNKGKITMSGTCSYDVKSGSAGTGVNALSIAGLCASNHYQYRPGNINR